MGDTANQVQAGLSARDSLEQLAQRPGMGWVDQLNKDPALQGRINWQQVQEAHEQWDHDQQGLTPEGAAILTLVTVYFTGPWAQAAGTTASSSVVTSGVAALGEGGFIAAGGLTVSTAVGGIVAAGVSTLASQAAVALVNNQFDLGATLSTLGSSESVRSLLTAMVTGGVLAGLNLDPTGLPTVSSGAQPFMVQLQQNLTAGAARALISTAINGGSLEDALAAAIKGSILDTVAAQTAFVIGDLAQANTLDTFSHAVAHAVAGCAVGAARTDSSGGCAAGAIGAAVGELAAEAYGRQPDTVAFASMMAGMAVAIAGGDAEEINQGSQAGGNAAANNYLNHTQWNALAEQLDACRGKSSGCSPNEEQRIYEEFQRVSNDQDRSLRAACADPGSQICRTMLDEANIGTQAQINLIGRIPDYYLAGSDFNTNVRLIQQRVDAYDILVSCNSNPSQCDRQRLDGLMRLTVAGVSVAALTAFSVELGVVGAGMIAEGAGTYCATRIQQCINLVNGLAEMASGVPFSGVSVAGSWASRMPPGYERFDGMPNVPPRTMAVVDTATDEIHLLTSNGRVINVPPAPLPPWTSAADNNNVKIVWGQGIQQQGMPWETYLANQLPAGTQLPPNFKTFDFFDESTGVATSAKTLDTMTSSRLSNPTLLFPILKGYVDDIVRFPGATLGVVSVPARPAVRELRVAVPASTSASQWAQILRTIEYGKTEGVNVIITGVK